MIIHRSFTGPTHLLSANVRGPVSFAVSVVLSGDKPFLSEPVSTKLSIDNYLMQCGTKATNEFLPKASFGLRVLSLPESVCLCVRPSVCVFGKHLLVRAITHHPFKLGSPNLDHRCKRPWLRSLLFWGVIELDLQGQIELQIKIYPILSLSMLWLTTNWSYNFQIWNRNAS